MTINGIIEILVKQNWDRILFVVFILSNILSVVIYMLYMLADLINGSDAAAAAAAIVLLILFGVYFRKTVFNRELIYFFFIFESMGVLSFTFQIMIKNIVSMLFAILIGSIYYSGKKTFWAVPLVILGAYLNGSFFLFLIPELTSLCFSRENSEKNMKKERVISLLMILLAVGISFIRFGLSDILTDAFWNGEENSFEMTVTALTETICLLCCFVYEKNEEDKDRKIKTLACGLLLMVLFLINSTLTIIYLFWFGIFFVKLYPDHRMIFRQLFRKNYKEFIILFTGIICLLRIPYLSVAGNEYTYLPYYLTYTHFGFVKRALIGEIFYRILGYCVSYDNMVLPADLIYFFVGCALLGILYKIFKNIKKINVTAVSVMCIFFMTCFMSYNMELKGKYELYALLLCVIAVYIIIKNSNAIWIVPFLTLLTIPIHTSSLFCIWPIFILCLFYRTIFEPGDHLLRNSVITALSIILPIGMFVYLSFFSYRYSCVTPVEGLRILMERAEGHKFYFQELFFNDVIFASPGKHINNELVERINLGRIIFNILRMKFFIPLIVLFFYQFWEYGKQYEGLKILFYRLLPMTALCMLPLYFFEYDYGRWNLQIIVFILISELFLQAVSEKEVVFSFGKRLNENITCIVLVICMALGGTFGIYS